MSTVAVAAAAGGVLAVVVVLWAVLTYNRLVRLRNRVRDAWADVDVVLKQRHDLIPNLVATVKGYAAHEAAVLDAVSRARAAAMGAGTRAEVAQAEGALERSLRSLFAVSEAYPDLKASAGFQQLMGQLGDLEGTLQGARRYYNGTVRDYNTACETLPSNLIASAAGFAHEAFFQAAEAERAVPQAAF